MAWLMLLLAGLFEVGWVSLLKFANPYHRPLFLIPLGIILIMTPFFLSLALRTIPIGTAYPIWVGIGILGTTLMGIFVFGEALSIVRVGFILLLIISIAGLKVTSP